MVIDNLSALEELINMGTAVFACREGRTGQWVLGMSAAELLPKATAFAATHHVDAPIYRLVPASETMAGQPFLFVKKVEDRGPLVSPQFHWSVVDTKEGAEMLRDVSIGPSPYFGTVTESVVAPY